MPGGLVAGSADPVTPLPAAAATMAPPPSITTPGVEPSPPIYLQKQSPPPAQTQRTQQPTQQSTQQPPQTPRASVPPLNLPQVQTQTQRQVPQQSPRSFTQQFQQGLQSARGVVQQFVPTQSYQQPPQQSYQQSYQPLVTPQYVYAQPPQQPPQQGMSGVRKGAIGFSLLAGLFPFPFNPLFIPIQMTIFIIMIIILLFKGYSFWTATLLSWLIPGLVAAVIHYMFLSGVLSIMGMGEGAVVTE